MNETICPKCGHKALSVATRCPRCGQAFDTRYYQHSSQGPRRRLAVPGLLIAGVVLMILAANMVWRLPGTASDRRASSAPAPPAPEPKAEGVATAPRTDSLATAPAGKRALTGNPPPAGTSATRAPAPVPLETRAIVSSAGAIKRYASTWINIRAGRSPRAPVLRILHPGDLVQVDSLEQGWYRVVSGQRTLGYVDRRLLSNSPRQTAP